MFALRVECKITPREAAELLGIPVSHLLDMEDGARWVSEEEAARIRSCLELWRMAQ